MQLKFKRQEFQEKAVESIADLFDGQINAPSSFSVSKIDMVEMAGGELLGYGNKLHIGKEQIEKNLNKVQENNELPVTELKEMRFNIEMETGTGKTFVYTKTIYELNKRYGFNKFVILVPSRAIKEGANKSLQITKTYFQQEYDGKKMDFFVYDSKKINQVRNFALSPTLSVMIVTIDAINKDVNLFNRETEKMDKTAREYIADCKPILIIDEPQSVDNTEKARKAIEMLSPLFELRFSATHKNKINTVYRLTPVDAYQMGIVKQICVANDHVEADYNKPHMKLVEVGNDGRFFAKLELDVDKDGIKRKIVKVNTGANLKGVTNRELYNGYIIAGIDMNEGNESIEFTNTEILRKGQTFGDFNDLDLKRSQIRRTIESHLDKERTYLDKGIKVLSLFFIDEVAKYRDYAAEDQRGVYAKIFDECYKELINLPRYAALKERFKNDSVEQIRNGYFSQDKAGKFKDTNGDTEADDSTYNLIMIEKEKLLSFENPLRFIWSHSALKEGWDNPNVFQICTLIDNKTVFTCRQKIGRGLRLCVNQNGERIEDKNINVLTVIAKESFAEFAETLQKEIEEETGIKFGILTEDLFIGITYKDEHKNEVKISTESAKELVQHFREKNYIDCKGTIKDTLKNDLKNGTLDLPARFENARERLVKLLKDTDRKVEIRQTKERVAVKRKDELFIDDKFIALWDRMKQKSYYRINTRIDELMHRIVEDIKKMPEIQKLAVVKETAKINIKQEGVTATKTGERMDKELAVSALPDIVRILSEGTGMPRANIGKILTDSGRLKDFINNPQQFIEVANRIIGYHQRTMSIEGIIYKKIDGQEYSLYEIFDTADQDEVLAYLSNTVAAEKSLYNRVIFDSSIESDFAQALEDDPNVEFFFKIPSKFKISTPVGNYNPDWAVYYKSGDEAKMYFIIETKGTTARLDLRVTEDIKIHCGEQHFKGINSGITWQLAKKWNEVKRR